MSKTIESSYEIKLLYDGECPLCLREVNFLRQKDARRGKVIFVDIADDNYSPEENAEMKINFTPASAECSLNRSQAASVAIGIVASSSPR